MGAPYLKVLNLPYLFPKIFYFFLFFFILLAIFFTKIFSCFLPVFRLFLPVFGVFLVYFYYDFGLLEYMFFVVVSVRVFT